MAAVFRRTVFSHLWPAVRLPNSTEMLSEFGCASGAFEVLLAVGGLWTDCVRNVTAVSLSVCEKKSSWLQYVLDFVSVVILTLNDIGTSDCRYDC